jgi:MFS family permease
MAGGLLGDTVSSNHDTPTLVLCADRPRCQAVRVSGSELPGEPAPPTPATAVGGTAAPPALTEPVQRAGRGWVAVVTVASIGLWAASLGPIQVLLALQAEDLVPHHKELVFGVVTGLGAAVAAAASWQCGAWSDRTTSRFGRRVPWVLGGSLLGAAALLVLAWAPNVVVMAAGWCLAQAGLNAMLAALTAAVPDQVPVRQRGAVGGWVGVAQTIGLVGGVGIATATGGITAGYVATAALLVVLTVPYLLRSRDHRVDAAMLPPRRPEHVLRQLVATLRRHPDFAWAWLTRFLVYLGNSLGTLYLLYFLDDAVGYPDPEEGVLILSLVYAAVLVVTTVVGGVASDRVGRRKPFVIGAGLTTGLAALVLAFVPTWPGAIVGALVLGAGFGVYLSVDLALVTEVLPAAADRARDLGLINIAVALPQVVAPVVAAGLVAASGYVLLYSVAAAVCVVGSILVRRIRAVG